MLKEMIKISFWKNIITSKDFRRKVMLTLIINIMYLKSKINGDVEIIEGIKVVYNSDMVSMFGMRFGAYLNGVDIIVIDNGLKNDIKDFILYHELGHIINKHTEKYDMSEFKRYIEAEFEADIYSFKRMKKLGYKVSDVISVLDKMEMNIIGDDNIPSESKKLNMIELKERRKNILSRV